MCPAVPRQMAPRSKRLATVVTAEWPLIRVRSLMHYHTTCFVRGIFAPLTLVSAVPADGAVTLLHVLVQTILSQIRRVTYVDSRVENAFTWKHMSIAWQQVGIKSGLKINWINWTKED